MPQVNQLDAEHQTALMWASAMGHAAVVKGLIGREAKARFERVLDFLFESGELSEGLKSISRGMLRWTCPARVARRP